jgi:hypothetical protein
MLSMNFYALQIVVHRPFATSRAPESPAFTSMAICTNAARSTSHILALQTQRPIAPLHNMHIFVGFPFTVWITNALFLIILVGTRFQLRLGTLTGYLRRSPSLC